MEFGKLSFTITLLINDFCIFQLPSLSDVQCTKFWHWWFSIMLRIHAVCNQKTSVNDLTTRNLPYDVWSPVQFSGKPLAGLRTFPLKPNVMKKDTRLCNSYLIIEFCNKRKLVGLDKFDDVISLGFTIIISTSFIKLWPEKCRKTNEFHTIKIWNLAAHLNFGIGLFMQWYCHSSNKFVIL